MHKIHCEKCGVGLYSDIKLKEWLCSPCMQGESALNLTCIACSLSNGVFISTATNQWVHLFCALLLKPYVKCTTELKLSRNTLNCTVSTNFPLEIFGLSCSLCKTNSSSASVFCSVCKESLHISCFINKNWKISGENFECGCTEKKKTLKKPKSLELPPVRGPTSCSSLEQIMENIIKADYLMIFRDHCEEYTQEQRENILKSLASNCYIDSTEEHLAIVINKSNDSINKKQKIQQPNNILYFSEISDVVQENEPKFVNNYREYEESKITSLDHIYKYYVRGHAYFSISQVLKHLRIMILSKLKRSETIFEKIYINQFWDTVCQSLQENGKNFKDSVLNDWNAALDSNQNAAQVTLGWHKEPFESRKYEMIDDYLEVSEGTKERLRTQIKGNCNGEHCQDLAELGPFELINSTWKSSNSDRAVRRECSDMCLCSKETCKNRQISLKQFQILNVDVKEIPTWGFDVYTYRNILAYIRHPLSTKTHKFISRSLSKAINSVTVDSWNILNALDYIIEDSNQVFTLRDKRYADGLKNAINGLSEILGKDNVLNEFQIHPKGTGVICNSPKGISKNSLIVEYFGQLYSPAKWYEKQDLIKSVTNKLKRKEGANETLPDFYNIMLERHMEDPDGYDILIVDPIFYGNYGSRLSHSCNPNCGTVTMVTEGKYSIGMYALTDINYLDELTFDYNSITESREEHLSAVCLCASSVCRSYYLAQVQNSNNIPAFHNFLHRISIMLKASISELNNKTLEICEKFCIRNAVLNNSPDWLKIWISLALEVVEKEVDSINTGIHQDYYKKIVIDSRLQNLVMTVDKVKYCMERSDRHPPYRLLNTSEVNEYLWGSNENSIRQILKKLMNDFEISSNLTTQNLNTTKEIRLHLLRIRDLFRSKFPNNWKGAGVADILHLVAYTQVFFYELNYSSFDSDSVIIRECEITKSTSTSKVYKSLSKKYSALHIQGTLSGWFKQTVEKPAASLSADKRGTLTLSCIESPQDYEYNAKTRKLLIDHLREKPHSAWPSKTGVKYPWGNFTNKAKVLGSPMFDMVFLDNKEILNRTLDEIDLPADDCTLVDTFY